MSPYPLGLGAGVSCLQPHHQCDCLVSWLTSRKGWWQAACPIPLGQSCKMCILALTLCKTNQLPCVAEAWLTVGRYFHLWGWHKTSWLHWCWGEARREALMHGMGSQVLGWHCLSPREFTQCCEESVAQRKADWHHRLDNQRTECTGEKRASLSWQLKSFCSSWVPNHSTGCTHSSILVWVKKALWTSPTCPNFSAKVCTMEKSQRVGAGVPSRETKFSGALRHLMCSKH